MDSILTSIKLLIGITEEMTDFDNILIMHINMVFGQLNQMGIGPDKCFKITSSAEKWSDFSTRLDMEMLKTYMFIKVKMIFDPSANSQLNEAYNSTAADLEYRLHTLWDSYMKSDTESIKEWVEGNEGA